MKNVTTTSTMLLASFTLFVFFLSHLFADAHLVNRCGALLSAMGAALVIFQATLEARMEKERAVEEKALNNNLLPVNAEVAAKIISARAENRVKTRIQIVICIAQIVFIGEILHGWGDVLYEAVFGYVH